jgi:hypothetical protein
MHTLSDEIPREPDELDAERRGPVREDTVRAEGREGSVLDRIRRLIRRSSP